MIDVMSQFLKAQVSTFEALGAKMVKKTADTIYFDVKSGSKAAAEKQLSITSKMFHALHGLKFKFKKV